jgi:hypothetical protein
MILLTEMWERTSSKNKRYFAGYLAKAKVVMFEDGPHPDRPGVTVWKLFVTENEQQPPPTRNAERGNQSWHKARHVDRGKAQAAGAALLQAAGRNQVAQTAPPELLDDSKRAIRDLRYGAGR